MGEKRNEAPEKKESGGAAKKAGTSGSLVSGDRSRAAARIYFVQYGHVKYPQRAA